MKVAFITGAGSGIGQATAIRLSSEGYALSLFDINGTALSDTRDLLAPSPQKPILHVGSVVSTTDLAEAVRLTIETFGRIDACAACAGVEVSGKLLETSIEEWERAISVNLMGVVHTAVAVLPSLLANGAGSFVAISSDAGTQGFPEWSAYCASKHAVIGLVRAMAVEFGHRGVRTNAVCPSFVETPMAQRIFADVTEEERHVWAKMTPLGRFARPDEIASVVHHLLSDETSYTNGLVYAVDGGETAGMAPPAQ